MKGSTVEEQHLLFEHDGYCNTKESYNPQFSKKAASDQSEIVLFIRYMTSQACFAVNEVHDGPYC